MKKEWYSNNPRDYKKTRTLSIVFFCMAFFCFVFCIINGDFNIPYLIISLILLLTFIGNEVTKPDLLKKHRK